MKILRKDIDKYLSGFVKLIAEQADDIWHVYNILTFGDNLKTNTQRKVNKNTSEDNRSKSERINTSICLKVENIEYDGESGVIRAKGRNIEENEFIKMGAYHTHSIQINKPFTIYKLEWDSIYLDRLKMACDPLSHAELLVCVMQAGLCHICLITSYMTIVRNKIEIPIPKKKGRKFISAVYQCLLLNLNFEVIKHIIIASPGFYQEDFMKYMLNIAQQNHQSDILDHKSSFILSHCSSGYKHAVKEVLNNPEIFKQLENITATKENKIIDQFLQMMQTDPDRCVYGLKYVKYTTDLQTIQTLLISDDLFRCNDAKLRKQYVNIIERVKNSRGDVHILSSLHVSGEILSNLTGIAAILHYPIPDLQIDDPQIDSDEEEKVIEI